MMGPFSVLFVCLAFSKIVITSSASCGLSSLKANWNYTQTLSSPNYNASGFYPASTICKWNIEAPYKKLVQLTFTAFDTYGYPTCGLSTDDTLKIYDANYNHSMIGKYCGKYLPTNVVSTGQYLYLVFESKSRSSSLKKGFRLEYKAVNNPTDDESICSPFNYKFHNRRITKVASTTTKYIKSPLYPNKYPSNIECVWYITASDLKKIKLTLKNVKIFNYKYDSSCSSGNDVLTVYDGSSTNSSKLKTICRSTYPSTTVTSSGSSMTIRFKSNLDNYFSGSTAGFQAEYIETSCGPTSLVADLNYAQTLTSPNYPGSYPESTTCKWTIKAPDNKLVQLNFTAFDTYGYPTCGSWTDDTLKIYDTSYVYDMIGKYCGKYLPANVVVPSGQNLYLVFESKSRYSSLKKGFKLEYKAVNNPTDDRSICSPFNSDFNNKYIMKVASTTTKNIVSPMYPNKYPSNIECVWYITASEKLKKIKLTLKNVKIFNYKYDSRCSSGNDVLSVRDGPYTFSKELETICTPTSSSTTVISSGSSMTIRFKSNLDNYFSGSTAGFQADYIETEESSNCGLTSLVADLNFAQTLSSSNYSANGYYPASTTCKWTIKAPYNKLVQLTFTAFDTYGYPTCGLSTDDTLKIYDADYEYDMIGKYCGNYLPANVVSSGQYLYVVFESKSRYGSGKNGFKLKYEAVYNPIDDQSICSPFNSESNNQNIHKVASTTTKYIKSPLYPNKYPSNIECVWYITASDLKKIKLTLKNVNIFNYKYDSSCSSGNDVLTVYDGSSTNSKELKTNCVTTYSSTTVTSSGSSMTIRFKSNLDNYFSGSTAGFQAEYIEIESSSTAGVVIGVIIGVIILISLIVCCVCVAKKRGTQGYQRTPATMQTTTTTTAPQYPMQPQGSCPPPPSGNYPPPVQVSYPPQGQANYPPPGQANYPPPGQASYPPPGQGSYPPPGQASYPPPGQGSYPPPGQGSNPPATQGSGYPQDKAAGGYPPPMQGSPYPVPSDPPPQYPGPPAYPPQQNQPYNPQATAQPNPPYPPT